MSKTLIRRKTNNTLIGDIEKQYGIQLDYPSNKKLATVLKETGSPFLSKLLQMADASRSKK